MKDQRPETARLWLSQPRIVRLLVAAAQEIFHEMSGRVLFGAITASLEKRRPLPATGFQVRDINFIVRAGRKPSVTVRAHIKKGPFPYSVDDQAPVRIRGYQFTTWGELYRLVWSDEDEPPSAARTPPLTTATGTPEGVRMRTEDHTPFAVESFSLAPWKPDSQCAHGGKRDPSGSP